MEIPISTAITVGSKRSREPEGWDRCLHAACSRHEGWLVGNRLNRFFKGVHALLDCLFGRFNHSFLRV